MTWSFFAGADGTVTDPGHVGLVIGGGKMIEAYATGFPIRVSSYANRGAIGFTEPWAGAKGTTPATTAPPGGTASPGSTAPPGSTGAPAPAPRWPRPLRRRHLSLLTRHPPISALPGAYRTAR